MSTTPDPDTALSPTASVVAGQTITASGCGKGIGRALAGRLADSGADIGADVVVNDVRSGNAHAVADEIGGAVVGDASTKAGVSAAITDLAFNRDPIIALSPALGPMPPIALTAGTTPTINLRDAITTLLASARTMLTRSDRARPVYAARSVSTTSYTPRTAPRTRPLAAEGGSHTPEPNPTRKEVPPS